MTQPKLTNPCTMYLIRHGQTEWNVQGIIQGQLDSSLTPEGIAVAQKLAQDLKDIAFSAIYSSDLLRAQKTASIIATRHRLTVKASQLLRERSFGKHDGTTLESFQQNFQKLLAEQSKLSIQERFRHKLSRDIESDEEIITRFIQFLREAALAHPNQNIAIVTHGGMLRTFLVHLGFGSYQSLPQGSIANSGYIILATDGVDFHIRQTVGVNLHQTS